MPAVLDASSLIFSLKVPAFIDLLEKRFDTLLIPDAVYQEVVTAGTSRGAPEVTGINRLFDRRVLSRIHEKPLSIPGLGSGECEALAAAKKRGLYCISDDRKAYQAGLTLGVRVVSLTALLVFLRKKGEISKTLAKKWLDFLVKNGYYLKPADYLAIVDALD